MEYLQRLLGTLQQAVNFVSSFTSYLFGDEAHPGAGETENERETSSHQNCEVETTQYGDVLPGGYLEVLEGPLTPEVISPHQEIQKGVEDGTTVVVSEQSEQLCKYEKESQQKLSDSCQLQAGTTQENLKVIVKQKKDLEELLEWEPKRTSLEEASQHEVQENVIDNKWEPVWPLDGSKEHEENDTGGIRVDQDKQLLKASWTQEKAQEGVPNGAHHVGEQQRGQEKIAWAGGFQHGELKDAIKVTNEQQLEAEKLEEIEAKENQKEERKKVAVEEEILESLLSEAENEKNQEEVLEEEEEDEEEDEEEEEEEEEEEGKNYQRELDQTGGIIAGLERELEETLWNEEFQQGAQDRTQLEEATAFRQGVLEEVNQIAECQQLETAKEEAGADEDQKWEPDSMAMEEGVQETKADDSETERNQKEEKEEKMERSHQWEPKGKVEEEREVNRRQKRELEETLWNKVVVEEAPDLEQFLEEQKVVLGRTTPFVEFQYGKLEEANKMAESQCLEGEKKHGEVEVEKEVEEKENVTDAVERKEGDNGGPNGEETGGGQQKVLEEEERSHQWESKKEAQETIVVLERELEGIWRNEDVQQETLGWNPLVTKQQTEPVQVMGCFGGLHHVMEEEVDKTVEKQQLELAKIEEGEVKGEEDKQWESNSMTVEEGIMEYMLDKSEMVGGQEEMLEGKEGKERKHQWEPKGEAGEEKGTNEKNQERELDQTLCNRDVLQRSSDWDRFVEEQWVGLEGTAASVEFQTGELEEVDKMVDSQYLESEVHGEVEVEKEVERKKDVTDTIEGKEEFHEGMPSEEETGGDSPKVLEEVEKSCQCESKEEAEDLEETAVVPERELVETLFSNKVPQMSLVKEQFVEEQRVGLERTAPSVALQCGQLEETEKTVEKRGLEVERDHADGVEVAEELKGRVDIVARKEGIQKTLPSGEEIEDDQQEDVEIEEEIERNCQWEPKEEVEEVEKNTEDQERELEGTWRNKEAQQDAPERTQFVIEQEELAKMPAWTEGLQPGLLDVVAEVKQLEVEQEEVKADKSNQQDLVIVKEIQGVLDEENTEEDYEEDPRRNKDVRTDQWELRETAMDFQEQHGESKGILDNSKDQQGKRAEAEESERDQPKEPVKNEAQATEEEHEERTGRILEKGKEEESMKLAEAWCLDKEILAKITGDQLRQLEEKQKSLQQQGFLSSVSLERTPFSGHQTFQVEVTSLDTSAQKERVLLRRKSSIRRAPSLKRPRPSVENLPQETDVTSSVNTPQQTDVPSPVIIPSQPPPRAPRPTMRHAGFGPMHPNMMAELQMRLRKPQ
ncbi:involucrin-like [Anolis sagrei]|uniref:involucrin-like n=1 Tax=Anolis sagrei TaxID=38937 RepID=UPI003521D206